MPSKNMLALDWPNLQLQDSIIVGMSPGLRSSSRITSLRSTRQNARQIKMSAALKSMLAGSLWGGQTPISYLVFEVLRSGMFNTCFASVSGGRRVISLTP